jgi:hypothetical protein
MKKLLCILIAFTSIVNYNLRADEGMWLLPLVQKLNVDTMHSLGLKLTAEDIYNINQGSLKDAIVIFDGGTCTGEIVSEEGLMLTNHHCGYDAIQSHSSVEHNYLDDGFWAKEKKEELPNPGLSVSFLVRVEDVTGIVLKNIPDSLSEKKRSEIIEEISDSLSNAAIEGTHYEARVESLFGGNNYYLFVFETYKDVRLVGAPPSSIGKFGYDTDNWEWPRHTGDFSVFRVYSAPDGTPAEYNADNIPMKPRHSLPVSLKPKKLNDYAMVIGVPGSTQRYMTSYEVSEEMNIDNPARIKIRGLRQDIWMKDMQADEKVNIQYASKYSESSNYWKFSIGENQGLKRLGILEKKQQEERQFTDWVNADEKRKEKYGNALELIRTSLEGRAPYDHALQYTYECFFSSTELIAFSINAFGLYQALVTDPGNKNLVDSLSVSFKSKWDDFYKNYNPATDMKLTPATLELFKENVPAEYLPKFYDVIKSKYKNNYEKFTANLFAKSIFADPVKFGNFIKKPTANVLEKDPAFQAMVSALDVYRTAYYGQKYFDDGFDRGHRLYIAGLEEMHPERKFYPDANSTMRLTYGTVQDYIARDAVHYDYFTTLKGVMEKEDPDNFEFRVPERLKALYESKDYGIYGEGDRMPVCFLTNNDITGGNSGSPVMDGEGNLIGLAFDGNWEAMSSNIVYEPSLQRCICVDIRYVLFIMDKYAGATNLIQEMKIIQ